MISFAVRLFLIVALAGAFLAMPSQFGAGLYDTAHAQAKKRRGWNPLSPLLRLFGPPKDRSKRGARRDLGTKNVRQPARLKKREVVRVRKSPDAHKVLVIGDFYAGGLYGALDMTFAQSSDFIVFQDTRDESGLATRQPVDWPNAIGPILDEKVADVVVIMIGANDFTAVSTETGLIQPDDEAWARAYGSRVQALLNQLAGRRIPVFWVGLAPMKDAAMSAYASQVSAIYRENVTLAGGVAVDIWDSFTGEDGQYASSGPDINGQVGFLRLKDGIGFSKSGYRKVAYFVEQELRSRLSSGVQLAAIQAISGEPENVELGSLVPLYDSRIGLKVDLAGEDVGPASPEVDSLQYKLIVAGEALPPVSGRIDDFRGGGERP